jgi:hypothetical protein
MFCMSYKLSGAIRAYMKILTYVYPMSTTVLPWGFLLTLYLMSTVVQPSEFLPVAYHKHRGSTKRIPAYGIISLEYHGSTQLILTCGIPRAPQFYQAESCLQYTS